MRQQNKELPAHKLEQFAKNITVLEELAKDNSNSEILRQFRGFGGLSQVFWQPSLYGRLMRSIRANFGMKCEHAIMDSLKISANSAYYTPKEVINFMYKYLSQVCKFTGGDILEPACGNGAFFEHMPDSIKSNSQITGIEYDILTSKLVSKIYPNVNVINSGLQDVNFDGKKYDLIIGNPPYGKEIIKDSTMPDISGYSIHNYFIAKCVRLLNDDGILAFVMPSFFMDKPKGHTRHIVNNEAVVIDVIRLPDNLFEQATVTVDLVFIRKTGNKVHDISMVTELVQGNAKDEINEFWIKNPNRVLGELKLKWVKCYKNYIPTCESPSRQQSLKYLSLCSFTQETIENYQKVIALIPKKDAQLKDKERNKVIQFAIDELTENVFVELEKLTTESINIAKKISSLHETIDRLRQNLCNHIDNKAA